MKVKDPCVGRCTTAAGAEFCGGCGRHYKDVAMWVTYSEKKKFQVLADISRKKDKK